MLANPWWGRVTHGLRVKRYEHCTPVLQDRRCGMWDVQVSVSGALGHTAQAARPGSRGAQHGNDHCNSRIFKFAPGVEGLAPSTVTIHSAYRLSIRKKIRTDR